MGSAPGTEISYSGQAQAEDDATVRAAVVDVAAQAVDCVSIGSET
jgi:hypothetical protein